MKDRFYFCDNWSGNIEYYPTLSQAKRAAAKKKSSLSTAIYKKALKKGEMTELMDWVKPQVQREY
jgi:hypothetical protein